MAGGQAAPGSFPPPRTVPPASVPPAAGSPTPAPAAPSKSMFRFLPLILGLLLIFGVGFWIISRVLASRQTPQTVTNTQTTTAQKVTITYWGLWEPSRVLEDVIKDFESQNPGVTVNYQQQSYRDYRERLQTAIAGNQGPDVFRFHASWVPMLKSELSPVPASVMKPSDFQSQYYPVVSEQLQSGGQFVGVPLMYDGLALFYNKDMLRSANADPPKTWADLRTLASRLTVRTNGQIQRGGLAIGNASNVEHFSDILGLLILQNGGDITKPTSKATTDAITFYTNFYTQDKVWDASLPSSTLAFSRGDAAMMLAPSWRAHDIMAQNPNLSFGIAPVPQLSTNRTTWASYWAEGVNAQSKNKEVAWKLIQFLSQKETLQKLYSDASKERSFGEIYPRTDMAADLATNEFAAAYLSDAPYAKSSYMNSFTHDNGINDQIIKYYEDAVTAITTNQRSDEALTTVDQGVRQVLRQYNLTPTP